MFIDEDVIKYVNKLMKKQENVSLVELEKYAHKNNVPIISTDVRKLLEIILKITKPIKVLEIGTAIGYSAIVMANACTEIERIDTIEISYDFIVEAKKNISKRNHEDKIRIIYGDANDVLDKITDSLYDFVFIDAAKGQYNSYFHKVLKLIKKNGIVFADNVLFKGIVAKKEYNWRKNKQIYNSLREFLSNISENDLIDTSILSIGDGVSISYLNESGKDITWGK